MSENKRANEGRMDLEMPPAPKAPILATPANMRVHGGPGVFAYDRYEHAEYSANPGDYYWQPDDKPLLGKFGKALILARRISYVEAV